MNETSKSPRCPVASESTRSSGGEGRPGLEQFLVQARRELEAAALDLSDAAQAAARAAVMGDQGSPEESTRLARLASRLYESANCRRALARRLTAQARPGEEHDG